MFHDERINAECGKMYRRGILLTTILTALAGCLRAFYLLYLKNEVEVKYLLLEAIIVISGVTILLIGLILYGRCADERETFHMYRYYRKLGPLFLIIIGVACMVALLPGMLYTDKYIYQSMVHTVPMIPNAYIALLVGIGSIYFLFHFKAKDISVNYSFIEDPRYYKRVFINIGKVAGMLLLTLICLLAIVALIWNNRVSSNMGLAVTVAVSYYPIVAFIYAVGYLYISWLEHRSYHYPNGRFIKSENLIPIIVALVFEIYIFIFSTFGDDFRRDKMIDDEMLDKFYRDIDVLMVIAVLLVSLAVCTIIAKMKKDNKIVSIVRWFIFLHAANLIVNCLCDYVEWNFIIHIWGAFERVHRIFYNVRLYVTKLPVLIDLVFSWLIICAMIKSKKLPKPFIIAPIVQTLLLPVTWKLCVYAQYYLWYIERSAVVSLQSIMTLATFIPVVVILNRSSNEETAASTLEETVPIE